MKKIASSIRLLALGGAGLQAVAALAGDSGRPLTASLTLDGFYDDNINSFPDSAKLPSGHSRGSTGFEVTPAFALNWPWDEQTKLTGGYAYTFKYYGERPVANSENYDQIHVFNLALTHSFNENYQATVKDSFVIGQEPDLLRAENAFSTYSRVSGDNLRNSGTVVLDGKLTPVLGFEASYGATLYEYSDTYLPPGGFAFPSTGGILNRIEQAVKLDSRWQLLPETVGVLGYQHSETSYIGDQQIDAGGDTSEARNNRSEYGYVGADQQFGKAISGGLRLGAHYTDYYNDPQQSGDVSPYVQLHLRYTYGPESYLEAGFTYDRAATDLVGTGGPSGVTVDSQSSVLYANLRHRLASGLYGSVMSQFQNSDYNGGIYNGKAEQFYTIGLHLDYSFTSNLSGHIGYNYDRLDSEAPMNRSFDRNRVYLGITATY